MWATDVVGRRVQPTPQYVWPLLVRQVGTEVWVKHENHTPTGAFKVRGGLIYAERLRTERPSVKGIVSATRGNHGQSLAFAGRAAGLDVTIVVPKGNSPDKNASMQGFGAELLEHGHDFQAASTPARSAPHVASRQFPPSTRISCSAWPRTPASCSTPPGNSMPYTSRSEWVRESVASSASAIFSVCAPR